MLRQTLMTMAAAAALACAAPAAAQSINERQRDLDARIDAGVRSGDLTNLEATRLRAEFADIARAEAQYRASGGGLTEAERSELDRRFDRLSAHVRINRNDDQQRREPDRADSGNINQRQADIAARIDVGVRSRTLTRVEAARLRAELDAIARIEAQYRDTGRGLTGVERDYLDRRLDALERQVRADRRDDDRRWTRLDERQAAFDRRLDEAVRERRVGSREAAALRAEFRSIARLERQYRRSGGGISQAERRDLNQRFDRMEANFRASASASGNLFDLLFGLVG